MNIYNIRDELLPDFSIDEVRNNTTTNFGDFILATILYKLKRLKMNLKNFFSFF